jgi:hypothetical protein
MPELGPFCQSCGMPLAKPADFGTSTQGFRVNDYCRYCYEEGRFTQPDLTLEEMIEGCSRIMVTQARMPEKAARALLRDTLPALKRWRKCASVQSEGRGFTGGDEIC